jgi:hypothetical protein
MCVHRTRLHIQSMVHDKAAANIQRAQKIQKAQYDKRHGVGDHSFSVGDCVLLRNQRKDDRKGGKLEFTWRGPYTIARIFENGTCSLSNEAGSTLKTKHNVALLKKYLAKGDEASGDEEGGREDVGGDEEGDVASEAVFAFVPPSIKWQKETCLKWGLSFEAKASLRRHAASHRATSHPIKIHQVGGDGNCLFRAVAYWLTGSENQYATVRAIICHNIKHTPAAILKLKNQETGAQYLARTKMRRDAVWGTTDELFAASRAFSVTVASWSLYRNQNVWQMQPIIQFTCIIMLRSIPLVP